VLLFQVLGGERIVLVKVVFGQAGVENLLAASIETMEFVDFDNTFQEPSGSSRLVPRQWRRKSCFSVSRANLESRSLVCQERKIKGTSTLAAFEPTACLG